MKTFTNYAEKKAKQFLNLLQGYTRGIRITAILILLLMGVNSAWGANITNISDVWLEGSMNSWANKPANWKFSTSDNNHYIGTFYISHSSTNYEFKIRCAGSGWTNGSLFAIGGYWFTSSNYDFTKNMTTSANNDQIQCMNKPTSGYIKLDCEFWGKYSSDSRLVIKQSAVAALSPSLSASSTSLIKSGKSTITASCSGGSGSYTYTYKVTCDGSDVTNSTLSATTGASVTFTAPSVTGKKTYTITVTAKDSHALLSGLATKTATKTITVEEAHNVTVSYKYGSTTIKANTTTSNVKYETASSITASTITGYKFSSWTLGSGIVNKSANTTTNPISITTNSNGSGYTLTANYEKAKYTLNFGVQGIGGSVEATAGGVEINSPHTADYGTSITLTATADDKYKFSKWVDGSGEQLSTENPYTRPLDANVTIKAVFINTEILYLKPNNNWKTDNAWFAACFKKTGSTNEYWVKMKDDDPCSSNGYYKAQIPEGDWDYVIFCRMNKDRSDLSWDARWNQTGDLNIPTDGKNLFDKPDATWNGATTTWKTYISTHQPLVFNVTVPAGTPNCYIIGNWDGWSQFTEMTKVDDTHYTVTMYDVCENSLQYKYCYGPSWGCEEVANTNLPTTTIDNRTHKSQDEVKAWIKYCLVGQDIEWDWNDDYSFDVAGNMSHAFNAKNHNIKVMSSVKKFYTHNEYTYNLHRSHTSVKIPHEGGNNNDLILQADLTGTYKFHFDPVNWLLTIEFPSKGYRLKITMTDGSGKVYTSNEVNNETETLSFFAPGSEDSELSADITLEYQGSQRATIPSTSFKTSGVYTAKLNSNKDGITEPVLYNGNYYIRTDGAHGGWDNYKTNSDNKMTYFVPREEEKYSYYWVEALPRAARDHTNGIVNVKACVANEYNENLAVMLEADKFTDGYGNVKIIDPDEYHREKVNVRFGYNPKTNFFERAMLTGSGNTNTFLNITAPDYVYLDNDQKVKLTTADKNSKFTDVSNWVYQKDIWVKPPTTGASVYLTAEAYNEEVNSLFGFDKNGTPIARKIIGTNSGELRKMRTIYDFKTNRMIIAWVPDAQDITTEQSLEADVLFIRHENDEVPQLTFTPTPIEGKIKGIQSQFFALELENARDKNAEEHYWISLPFDCVVGSISGVPGYMEIWGIQRYNGEERAQKGWFKETSTFWEWLEPDDVMNAGEGYVLSFDKKAATWNDFDVHNDDGELTGTESLLRLYFPSTTKGFEFKNSQPEREYVNQPCTITRDNRHLQDGNWKIIGPMSYNNVKATPTKYGAGDDVWKPEQDGDHVDVPEGEYKWSAPMFRYKYWEDESGNSWKYIPEDGTTNTYNSFFGYMVQFAGLIQWNSVSVSEPVLAGLTARRNTDTNERTNITMRLEIVNAEGKQQDQTFVALDVEATTTFDPNKDLNKIFNDGETNIYSLSEGIPFAGNALPMEESVVPVGVQIAAEGEYTFAMPDGTEGMVVELIDYERDITTNLLLFDYTVTLPAGSNESRFALHIQPNKSGVTTGIEGAYPHPLPKGKGTKFLIDGKLVIRTAEGVIYDAQGHVVQ